jgi:hypothetical protein
MKPIYRALPVLAFVLMAGFVGCGGSDSMVALDGGGASHDGTTTQPTGDAQMGAETSSGADSAAPTGDDQSSPVMPGTDGAPTGTGNDAQTPVDGSADGPPPSADAGCTATQVRCGSVCTEPATDHAHCGGCTISCGNSQACVSGVCRNVSCEGGTTACAGVCVDTQTSAGNCGACGRACGPGSTCTAGSCACSDASLVLCPTGCFNTATDANHCGGCGNSCGAGGSCVSGVCMCAATASQCGSGCTNLATDPNNCGMCMRSCAGGSIACASGVCQLAGCDAGPCCAPGYTECTGFGIGIGRRRVCADLQTDPMNCGACANRCMNACVGGVCM